MDITSEENVESLCSMLLTENIDDINLALHILRATEFELNLREYARTLIHRLGKIWFESNTEASAGIKTVLAEICTIYQYSLIDEVKIGAQF